MAERLKLGSVWKKAFMTPKTAEGNALTEAGIDPHQATDPATDPAEAIADGVEGKEATTTPASRESPATISLEEYERVKSERDQLFDRIARLQAEFDNARKREARERTEFRDFAAANAIEQFLPVLDNFQLALKSNSTADQLRDGVELIVKQMDDVLRSLNVHSVETVGAAFDPRVHEALDSVEKPDLPDQQVFEEVRRGYRIKERLLRPALVRVVSNPKQKEA